MGEFQTGFSFMSFGTHIAGNFFVIKEYEINLSFSCASHATEGLLYNRGILDIKE